MKKAILLLSGGIDSPVAGYMMKKKGLEITFEPPWEPTKELRAMLGV